MYAAMIDIQKPLWWTVDGVLTKDECRSLIDRIEALGPTVAPITRAEGPVLDLQARNNARVMFDDPALGALLFERIRRHVPAELSGLRVCSANERFRCYRYSPGQRFAPHYDGAFVRSRTERSLLTFIVYLNEGFEGGETAFLDFDQAVKPKTGMALLFQHAILHEGVEVRSGVKYAARSDIMYRSAAGA